MRIDKPTIADYTNATHDHSNAANGGALSASAIAAGTFIPVVGGSSSAAGMRVMWWQKSDIVNSSAMQVSGAQAATITGGSGISDSSGQWARPTGAAGSTARFSAASANALADNLPDCLFRIRTPSTLTNTRILISLNNSLAGVNTDTPSTVSQKGLYVRYSTAIPDAGWVIMSVDGAGQSTTASVLAIAASTVYLVRIKFTSVTTATVTINGTATNISNNLALTGISLGPEVLIGALAAFAPSIDIESIYLAAQ